MSFYDLVSELLRIDERISIVEAIESKCVSLLINYVSHFLYLVESTTTTKDLYTIEHWKKELPMFLSSCEKAINNIPGRNKKERVSNYLSYIFKKALKELMNKFDYRKESEIKNNYIKELIELNKFGEIKIEDLGLTIKTLKNDEVKLIKIVERNAND